MKKGFAYLVVQKQKPVIFNSDQGSQFISSQFIKHLTDKNLSIFMDGKGRVFDNIFIERFWRSIKYEEVYLNAYENVWETERRTGKGHQLL